MFRDDKMLSKNYDLFVRTMNNRMQNYEKY